MLQTVSVIDAAKGAEQQLDATSAHSESLTDICGDTAEIVACGTLIHARTLATAPARGNMMLDPDLLLEPKWSEPK